MADEVAGWVVVWRGRGEAHATVVAEGLEADGIPAQVVGSPNIALVRTLPDPQAHAVAVPAERAVEAKELLEARGEAANMVSDDSVDFASSNWGHLRPLLMASFVALVAALAIGFAQQC